MRRGVPVCAPCYVRARAVGIGFRNGDRHSHRTYADLGGVQAQRDAVKIRSEDSMILSLVAFAAAASTAGGTPAMPGSTALGAGLGGVPQFSSLRYGQGPLREALPVAASVDESALLARKRPGLSSFFAGAGRGWTVTFDRRSGEPMLFQGPG